jgi:hypothetical protein
MDVAAFYGNCQAKALGNILSDHPPFAGLFRVEILPPVYNLHEGDHQRVLEAATRAKLFVHQPITGQQFAPADTKTLVAAISPSSMSLCFPVLWFDAYGPDVQYLKVDPAQDRAPSDYHSTVVLSAYLLGRTVNDAVRTYEDRDALDPELAVQIMRDAVRRLKEREGWIAVNVPIADFVESECIGRRLFHTFNHPSSVTLFQVANEILSRLDLPSLGPDVQSLHRNILAGPRMPELVALHEALGLEFVRYTDFHGRKGTSDALNFAEASFRHYSEIRLETLMSAADLSLTFLK